MLFVDPTFLLIFLPMLILGLVLLKRFNHVRLMLPGLLLASGIFYGAWSFTYLGMLICVVGFNFYISKLLCGSTNPHKRRIFLITGLCSHIGLLGYFKYTGFIAELFMIDSGIEIVLPLAISFYTFQQISFLIDVYREEQRAVPILNYFTYILFFPQLIAGPIVQYPQVGAQIELFKKGMAKPQYSLGLIYLAIGLAKKWFIADPLAPLANSAFQFSQIDGVIEPLLAWLGLMAYTFQLYFDFSAYGDMAIGIALLVGIKLPINFDSPYKAENISAFWRKWHITLGAFLKQYLFIPLGGSKINNLVTMRNLFIVMLLGGIWHGAGLGFVLWGVLHGCALIIHLIYKKFIGKHYASLLKPIYILATFSFVCLAWVPFKAVTIDGTLNMYQSLFSLSQYSLSEQFNMLKSNYGLGSAMTQTLLLIFLPILVWGFKNSHYHAESLNRLFICKVLPVIRSKWAQIPTGLTAGVAITLGIKWMVGIPVQSFLYFQF